MKEIKKVKRVARKTGMKKFHKKMEIMKQEVDMKRIEEEIAKIKKVSRVIAIEKQPIFHLEGWSGWTDYHEDVDIYLNDIKMAEVGKVWSAETNIVRAAIRQELMLLSKNDNGAILKLTTVDISDDENPDIKTTDEYIWLDWMEA